MKHLFFSFIFLIGQGLFAQMNFEAIKINSDNLSKERKTAMVTLVKYGNDKMEYASGESHKKESILADTFDLFEIGSVSKMFTAIAILQLMEQDKINLTDSISKFYNDDRMEDIFGKTNCTKNKNELYN